MKSGYKLVRLIGLITTLLITFNLSAQQRIIGRYRNHFTEKIRLNTDKTFIYKSDFDLVHTWQQENWTIRLDTIYFKVLPLYTGGSEFF